MSREYVAIGTQLLSHPGPQPPTGSGHPWTERVPPPGTDATLLAVVPIPGTRTSLAIVGYAITTSGGPGHEPAPAGAGHGAAPGPGGLLIDDHQRRVWVGGSEIVLTFQEFELLTFLSTHPATVFSRAELIEQVWRTDPVHDGADPADGAYPAARDRKSIAAGSRTVDVHVSRLRRKLGPVHGQCLVTEHRAGYQFRPSA